MRILGQIRACPAVVGADELDCLAQVGGLGQDLQVDLALVNALHGVQ